MSGKNSGDHLMNRGPIVGRQHAAGSRADRRRKASKKHGGKTDVGRDEMFLQRLQALPSSKRLKIDEKGQQ